VSNTIQAALGLVAVASVAQLALLVRQRRLRAKYLLLWGAASLALLPLVAVPDTVDRLAGDLGVAYPPAAYLTVAVTFLYGVCMHFSWELSRLEERSRALAEEVALLQARVEQVERGGRADTAGAARLASDPPEEP
jgi:hypothetical protein